MTVNKGNIDVLKRLVECKADISTQSSALPLAYLLNRTEMCEFLIEHRAPEDNMFVGHALLLKRARLIALLMAIRIKFEAHPLSATEVFRLVGGFL